MRTLIEYLSWGKSLLLVCALTFLYTASFLYDDEEGKIQNRLEVWWCQLDDAANTAVNMHLRIIQRLAKRARSHTELLFGKRLVSYQSIGVGICWGMISAKLMVVVIGLSSGAPPFTIITMELVTALFFWYMSREARSTWPSSHGEWLRRVVLFWITCIVLAYFSGTLRNRITSLPAVPEESNERFVIVGLAVIPLYTVGVIFFIPICITFIAVLRRTLFFITQSRSNKSAIAATVLQSGFLLGLVSLHVVAVRTLQNKSDFREYIFQMITTTPIMGYAYSMTIFLILLLAHRVFWGVMQRPIYALQRMGGDRRKKLFAVIGIALLIVIFPKAMEAVKTLIDLVKFILG